MSKTQSDIGDTSKDQEELTPEKPPTGPQPCWVRGECPAVTEEEVNHAGPAAPEGGG